VYKPRIAEEISKKPDKKSSEKSSSMKSKKSDNEEESKRGGRINLDADIKQVENHNQMSDGYSSSCKVKSTKSHESRSLTQSEKGAISRLEFNNKDPALSRLARPGLDVIEEEYKNISSPSEKQSIIADSFECSLS